MADVQIGSKIKLDINKLPPEAPKMLMEALSIPNLEKEKARNMDQWGWQKMPDYIALWDIEGDDLIMPRGFLDDFLTGMKMLGVTINVRDETSFPTHNEDLGEPINLRPWQEPQVKAIFEQGQGIIKSPAGSGKTVATLAAIQSLKAKALVIVNTKDILWQWQERVHGFWHEGVHIGQVGDGVFDISDTITIATAQTIHSRYEELLESGFFSEFGFVCLDECHHATAETYNRIMDSFAARYRIGVSATPDKSGEFELATRVLGPIICDTDPDNVDALQKPIVYKIPTKFGFDFRGHGGRRARSNYPQMISALTEDELRNRAITANILRNKGHHQLVISKRLNHLNNIAEMLSEAGFPDPVVTIIGENDNEHRRSAKALAEREPCVILSTLADEAMDIPRLDRLHLIFPQKNSGLVTQQVGRVERTHEEKTEAIIFDYCDLNIGPLENQWRTRRFEVYEQRGYTIKTLKLEEIFGEQSS
jgi:superfamily II DNA or RNA helicase